MGTISMLAFAAQHLPASSGFGAALKILAITANLFRRFVYSGVGVTSLLFF
jgi:hypothetical protein